MTQYNRQGSNCYADIHLVKFKRAGLNILARLDRLLPMKTIQINGSFKLNLVIRRLNERLELCVAWVVISPSENVRIPKIYSFELLGGLIIYLKVNGT